MHIYEEVNLYTYTYIHICICTFMKRHICMYAYVHMYICMYIYVHIYVHIYLNLYMHTYINSPNIFIERNRQPIRTTSVYSLSKTLKNLFRSVFRGKFVVLFRVWMSKVRPYGSFEAAVTIASRNRMHLDRLSLIIKDVAGKKLVN
jgi:hypothetical protein